MTLSSPPLRRFVRRALLDATGAADPDRAQLASAFGTLCDSLFERLEPVFGTAAVSALFARSVHVATSEFAWLADVLSKTPTSCAVEGNGSFDRLDVSALAEGLSAVLAHNIGLLTAFVGEDVVLPLVEQAWGRVEESRTEGDQ